MRPALTAPASCAPPGCSPGGADAGGRGRGPAYGGHVGIRRGAEPVRERLVRERAETQERIAHLSRDLDSIVEATTLVATDDEHDPEGSTIAFERAQVQALLDQGRAHLVDLDRALGGLDDGSHGRCEVCGRAIPADRLAVRPAARMCVACAGLRSSHRG